MGGPLIATLSYYITNSINSLYGSVSGVPSRYPPSLVPLGMGAESVSSRECFRSKRSPFLGGSGTFNFVYGSYGSRSWELVCKKSKAWLSRLSSL